MWGQPVWPLAAATGPPLVKSQNPRPPTTLPPPPPDAAAPLPRLTTAFTGLQLRGFLLVYHTFQFTQKILSFVLKNLQIKHSGRHLWTHTHLFMDSGTCYKAAFQPICILFVKMYSLFGETCFVFSSILSHVCPEPFITFKQPKTSSISAEILFNTIFVKMM